MSTTNMAAGGCPVCLTKLDAATGLDHDHRPAPGYASVCAYCGALLKFNHDLLLEPMPDDEFRRMPGHFQLLMLRVQQAVKERNHNKRET